MIRLRTVRESSKNMLKMLQLRHGLAVHLFLGFGRGYSQLVSPGMLWEIRPVHILDRKPAGRFQGVHPSYWCRDQSAGWALGWRRYHALPVGLCEGARTARKRSLATPPVHRVLWALQPRARQEISVIQVDGKSRSMNAETPRLAARFVDHLLPNFPGIRVDPGRC